MEVAPLQESGGTYQRAPAHHSIAELAEAVYKRIANKSAKYGRPRSAVHLLLYATDYRFDISGSAGDLLAHRLHREQHCFATILYTRLNPSSLATNRILFPLSQVELRKLESEELLNSITEVVFEPRQSMHRATPEAEARMRERMARKKAPPPDSDTR